MFSFYKRRNLIVLIIAIALFFANNSAHASYDVIKAKTVEPENTIPVVKGVDELDSVSTYNDPELPDFSPENSLSSKLETKTRNFFKKRKNKKLQEDNQEEFIGEEINENNVDNDVVPKQEQAVDENNKFQINADKITYDDADGNVYADGHVEIISKAQDVTLKADQAILDKPSQTIKLFGNVKIIKDGLEMTGQSLIVDLNEQNILMDNPTTEAYSFLINAQEGYLISNDIQMLNGMIKSAKETEMPFQSRGFMRLNNVAGDMAYDPLQYASSNDVPAKKQSYRIDAKEIVITSYKDHDALLLKKSNIFYNDHKIIRNSDIEIITDKKNQVAETNTPEIGTLRSFGTFLGYGFAYKLPHGQTLKLIPALVYGDSTFGVGVMGRHRTPNSVLEAGWATSTSNLVVRGHYKFSDNFAFRYGRNTYIQEGFHGARRSGYAGQFQYIKSYKIDDLNASFRQGIFAGIFSDYQKHDQEDAYSTTRFRYTGELNKAITSYENKEQDFKVSLNLATQMSATLYGSGETQAIARFGPTIKTRLKRWESHLAYVMAGIHGDSPFYFDKYRYGKSTIMLNQKFNLNEKLALGYKVFITPMKDNIEEDLITESRLYAIFGPRDLKLLLSYDFVRQIAHLDFMFLIGTDSAKINFDKLTTKNMDGGSEKRDFYKNAKRVKIEQPENI